MPIERGPSAGIAMVSRVCLGIGPATIGKRQLIITILSAYFQWAIARTQFIPLPPVVISSLGFIHFTYCVPLVQTSQSHTATHLPLPICKRRDEKTLKIEANKNWQRSTRNVQTLSASCVEHERIEIKWLPTIIGQFISICIVHPMHINFSLSYVETLPRMKTRWLLTNLFRIDYMILSSCRASSNGQNGKWNRFVFDDVPASAAMRQSKRTTSKHRSEKKKTESSLDQFRMTAGDGTSCGFPFAVSIVFQLITDLGTFEFDFTRLSDCSNLLSTISLASLTQPI